MRPPQGRNRQPTRMVLRLDQYAVALQRRSWRQMCRSFPSGRHGYREARIYQTLTANRPHPSQSRQGSTSRRCQMRALTSECRSWVAIRGVASTQRFKHLIGLAQGHVHPSATARASSTSSHTKPSPLVNARKSKSTCHFPRLCAFQGKTGCSMVWMFATRSG